MTEIEMMAMSKKDAGTEEVLAHVAELDESVRETVEFVRKAILSASPLVSERIKWNNPSFYYNGPLEKEDPKKYPREIAVFNLFKNRIMLVVPQGARVDDGSGFLTGNFADGRRVIVFQDLADAKKRKRGLQTMIEVWMEGLQGKSK